MRDSRHAVLVAAVLVHLVFVLSLVTGFLNPLFFEAVQAGQGGDFYGIYQAGVNVREGRSIYARLDRGDDFTLSVPYYYFYRYAPPTAFAFAPATALVGPVSAYWLWAALNEILLLALAAWVLRLRDGDAVRRSIAAALWLVFTPFYLEQYMGQFSFLMAALIAALVFTRFERMREPLPLGRMAAWVASIALKSYTALFAIPLFVRGRRKSVAIAAAASAALVLPYFAFRPQDLQYFLAVNLSPFQQGQFFGSLGFHTLLRQISQVALGDLALVKFSFGFADLALANVPVIVVTLAIAAFSVWMTLRSKAPLEELLAFWVLVFFLVFKEVWEYHYVMLLPVLTLLYLRSGSWWVLAVWIVLALPTPYALYASSYRPHVGWELPAGFVHYGSKSVPAVVLYAWLVRRLLGAERFAATIPASARARVAGFVQ